MLELHYLVSAWAGVVRDEHQLLGDALACLLNDQVLPPEHLAVEVTAGVQLTIEPYDNTRAKDVWSTVGGAIKPSFELIVTTAGDASPFVDLPPAVERVPPWSRPPPRPGGLRVRVTAGLHSGRPGPGFVGGRRPRCDQHRRRSSTASPPG